MATSILATIKKKKQTDLTGTIYIRGYFNRKPVASISTGQKIRMEDWDPIRREVYPTAANATMVNMVIGLKLQDMNKQLLQKKIMGAAVNRQQVIKAVRSIDESADFTKFCTDRIKEYKNKETRRTYNSEVSKILKFQDAISFNDIDTSFLNKYRAYMEQTLKNAHNTVWKTFKFMHTMLEDAKEIGGIIVSNPMDNFNRGVYIQTKRAYLTVDQCDLIEKQTASKNDMIRKVSIYFLLMAYTGMRFSDAMRFDPELHIINGERVVMNYQKYKTDINNKMHARLKNIVELLKNNRLNNISNHEFNTWLKTIAGVCNINVKLSAHVGRHTMGSILTRMEIPEEQIRIILGQRDIRSTRVYTHMESVTIDKAMDKLNTL